MESVVVSMGKFKFLFGQGRPQIFTLSHAPNLICWCCNRTRRLRRSNLSWMFATPVFTSTNLKPISRHTKALRTRGTNRFKSSSRLACPKMGCAIQVLDTKVQIFYYFTLLEHSANLLKYKLYGYILINELYWLHTSALIYHSEVSSPEVLLCYYINHCLDWRGYVANAIWWKASPSCHNCNWTRIMTDHTSVTLALNTPKKVSCDQGCKRKQGKR